MIKMIKELEDAIQTAVKNMGEYFTSHNVIDFIRSRQHYKIFYDAEVADKMTKPTIKEIEEAERQINTAIGMYLKKDSNQIIFRGYLGEKYENIHGINPTKCIGYYQRENWKVTEHSERRDCE